MEGSEIEGFTHRLMMALDQAGVPRRGRTGCVRDFLKTHGLEISKVSVYSWLRGDSRPDLDKVALLAKFAKTSCDYLLGMDAAMSQKPIKILASEEKSAKLRLELIRQINSEVLEESDLLTLRALAAHLAEARTIEEHR